MGPTCQWQKEKKNEARAGGLLCWLTRAGANGLAHLSGRLARARRAKAACSNFFDKRFFLFFKTENKHKFCLKTPKEFKLVSKILYKQNTLNKTQNLVFLKYKIIALFKIE